MTVNGWLLVVAAVCIAVAVHEQAGSIGLLSYGCALAVFSVTA